MLIEVYGIGCRRCYTLYYNVGLALWDLRPQGVSERMGEIKVNHVKDPKLVDPKLKEIGAKHTPLLLIDGVKMSEDSIPEVKQIRQWIEQKLGLPPLTLPSLTL